jgi:P-type Mg2+ transporter
MPVVRAERLGQSGEAAGATTISKRTAAASAPAKLLRQLGSSPAGLDAGQVARQRSACGPNTLTKDRATALRVLVRQFESPLVYLLLLAAGLSFATRDVSDGSIITAILVINAALGFSQEYRSQRAVQKLSHLISNKVAVRRDGFGQIIDTGDLVPGDIVTLKEGGVVPADLKLIEAARVEVDESQLTGESVQVTKTVQVNDATAGDSSLVFTGSVVVRGELVGVAYATGNDTALGKIAALSRGVRKVTQYQRWLGSFSLLLMRIVLCSLAVTVVIKLALGHGAVQLAALLTFVIALAVSVVPEALPVIATLTMARGAVQMARQKVVVKRLSSLEDLGSITILCTDKTGTLTEGKLTVTRLVSSNDELFQTLVAASSDPESAGQAGTQAAFDRAFGRFIPEAVQERSRGYTILGEVPFDPDARRRRILLSGQDGTERVLVVIGSPETLLLGIADCPARPQYLDQIAAEGRQGMRHLGVAYRLVGNHEPADILSLEHDLTFLGFVTLSDPLRPGTADTIAAAGQLGVAPKILTGDSVEVAGYVAGQVGLRDGNAPVFSGADLSKLSDAGLATAARRSNVFARVSPEQKYQLISALKHSDVVGYEGDGINDAPSLKLADVGIAVDSATDVAKANADIILLDRKLAVIINGIGNGRAIFANINKYIIYTMVGNFGNFIALTVLFLLATSLPLLPRQLLLLSLLTDLPLVAISTDSVDSAALARPPESSPRLLLSTSMVLGGLTAVAEMLFFLTVRNQSLPVAETSLYLFLSFTQLIVIFCVRNRSYFWRASRPSSPLLAAMSVTAIAAIAITYVPKVAHLFSFTGPSATEIGRMALWLVVYFVALDLLKVSYYRLLDGRQRQPLRPGTGTGRTHQFLGISVRHQLARFSCGFLVFWRAGVRCRDGVPARRPLAPPATVCEPPAGHRPPRGCRRG